MSASVIDTVPAGDSGWDVPADDIVWEGAPHPAGPGSRAARPVSAADRLIELLGLMDREMARAVGLVRQARLEGTAERQSGLPLARLVALATGRTGAEVRFICRAEQTLTHLPNTDTAFAEGRLSWSQVRGIITAVKPLRVAQMAELDAELAGEIGQGEPDRIVQRAFGWADLLTHQDTSTPERDPGDRRSFRIQPDLLGGAAYSGYDRLDAVTTIVEAAQAAADAPVKPDTERRDADGTVVPAELLPATARQAQLAEGLRRVAAAFLGRSQPSPTEDAPTALGLQKPPTATTRPPRPSITIVIDHRDALTATGRALARWHGGPIPLTPLTADRLRCDPQVSTVITDSGRPIAIGDATAPITTRHYRTLHAVDRGCRLPGCNAPPQHCDAHHIIPRQHGGPTSTDNLLLVCRDCHSRIHKRRLDIRLDRHTRAVTLTTPDGHTFTSLPA